MSSDRPVSAAALILGFQGGLNIVFGSYGLLRPTDWQARVSDGFEAHVPMPAAYTISLQLLNMGVFTIFAASRPSLHRRGLIARTCIHGLTGYLFWRLGGKIKDNALVELGFAAANAVTLAFFSS